MKKTRKNFKAILTWAIIGGCIVIGLISIVIGAIKLFNYGILYEEEKSACENKDYSSYVKKIETVKIGNENINNQIKLYKDAMQRAADANDSQAFGQLMEKYNELLAMQAQTKTTEVSYDYSGVDEAKNNCVALANKHKDLNMIKGIVFTSVGGFILLASTIAGLIVSIKVKKQSTKKR